MVSESHSTEATASLDSGLTHRLTGWLTYSFYLLTLTAFLILAFPFFKERVLLAPVISAAAALALLAAQRFVFGRADTLYPTVLAALMLLANLPYFVAGRSPLVGESAVLLGLSFAAFASLNVVLKTDLALIDEKRANRFFAVAVLVYSLVFLGLSLYRFAIFGDWMSNLPGFVQGFYLTLRGTFFYNGMSWIGWKSHFATHNSLFFLFLVPFYYLAPKAQTLIVAQFLLLAGAAIPLYLLSKGRVSPFSGCLLALSFLFLPTVISQHLYPFNTRDLSPLFLILAVYFFEKDNFRGFIVSSLVMITVIETNGLTLAAFSLYALLKKKSKRWVLSPLLIGLPWFAVSLYLVIPYFASLGTTSLTFPKNQFVSYYGHLGETPSEVVKTLIRRPQIIIELLLTRERLGFIFLFTSPFALILPFLNPLMVVGIPDFLLNVLSRDRGTFSPYPSYNVMLASLLVASTIISLGKPGVTERLRSLANKKTETVQLLASFTILALAVSQFHVWLKPAEFLPAPQIATLRRIAERVKPGSKVLVLSTAARGIESRLSDKVTMYITDTAELVAHPDYVIVERPGKTATPSEVLGRYHKWVRFYEENPGYRPVVRSSLYELLESRPVR